MVLKYKKIFYLCLATLLGIGIILFAWKGSSLVNAKISFESKGTNSAQGNSWQDSLKVIPQDSFSRLFGLGTENKDVAGGVTTTATDLLGRELLTSYALAQKSIGGPMTDADTQGIAGIVADKVMADNTKQYTEKDIVIVPSSEDASRHYVQEISQALTLFARKNTIKELAVVAEAMDSGDASKLAPLATTVTNLNQLIKTLLAIKTTKEGAGLHLYLIQSYTTILSGIIDMQSIITDPALGMRGIAKYKNGMNAITALNDIMSKVK